MFLENSLIPQKDCILHMPFVISEFTDFFASYHHAKNVGTMFRGPENALPPNWLHMPIGYNGRASTVVVSGTQITRPMGQLKPPTEDIPYFGPSKRFDFELELGAIIGTKSESGERLSIEESDDMIFGYVILNDWSARDIQAWEYQPLGPFQAKATATTISPWIVTKAALEPFRTSTPKPQKPLLKYLEENGPMLYNINLSVSITTKQSKKAHEIVRSNYSEMYYSSAQQIAHHTSSGCKMSIGDLIGSGTISGPEKHQYGSMLELSWGGKELIQAIAKHNRMDYEEAERLLLSEADGLSRNSYGSDDVVEVSPVEEPRIALDNNDLGLGTAMPQIDATSLTGGASEEETLVDILSTPISRLVTEVRRSFDYYEHQLYEHSVDRVILCGGAANLPLIREALSEELGIEQVTVADPSAGAVSMNKRVNMNRGSVRATQYMVAVGLAARGLAEL